MCRADVDGPLRRATTGPGAKESLRKGEVSPFAPSPPAPRAGSGRPAPLTPKCRLGSRHQPTLRGSPTPRAAGRALLARGGSGRGLSGSARAPPGRAPGIPLPSQELRKLRRNPARAHAEPSDPPEQARSFVSRLVGMEEYGRIPAETGAGRWREICTEWRGFPVRTGCGPAYLRNLFKLVRRAAHSLTECSAVTVSDERCPMRIKELIDQAQALPGEERALVVDSLFRSLNPPESTIDQKWASVAQERLKEVRSGAVETVPGDDLFANIRNDRAQ